MPDVDPKVDDPLGDISTVVGAAERLAEFVLAPKGLRVTPELAYSIKRDAETVQAVCKRLKGRL